MIGWKKVIHPAVVYNFFSSNHRNCLQNRPTWLYNITNTQPFGSGCIINLPLEKDTPLVPRGVSFSSWKIYYTPLQMPVYLYNIGTLFWEIRIGLRTVRFSGRLSTRGRGECLSLSPGGVYHTPPFTTPLPTHTPCGQTNTCENFTLPQTSFAGGKNPEKNQNQ